MNDWPHAPVHRFGDGGIYFITGGTLHKQHLFAAARALDALQELLFEKACEHGVTLQAWCVFSNHYHLVASADEGARVKKMIERFYVDSAIAINRRDGTKRRKVWYQFRDTQLTFERSWLARLKYTHENAVHHGLVVAATEYPWCSARWFAETARPAFVETLRRIKIDKISVDDDFGVRQPQLPLLDG
jgi:putative transposase